ncbi:MAG: hypothetical protein SNH88_05245 [Rikenellaceae bacterium]
MAAFVAIATMGCASEQVSDIAKLTSLYSEIKEQSKDLSEDQIKEATKKLDDLKKDIDLKNLSPEERKMVEKVSEECSNYLKKTSVDDIKRDVERISKDAKEVLNVLIEALKE